MKKNLIFLCSLVFFLITQPAFAQILIEEGKVNLTATPGETLTGTITVHNTSDKPFSVRAYWEDFVYLPPFDGKKSFLPAGSTPYSMAKWFQFSPREFTLPQFSKKEIKYSINPPQDLKGGHYGVLFVEKAVEGSKERVGVNIVTRVGSLFFVEPEVKERKAHLSDFSFEDKSLKGQIENTGDIILVTPGVFYVMGAESLVVDRGEISNLYLPPQERGNFTFNFSQDLKPGQYTVVITFDLGEGQSLVKEIDFEKSSDGNFKILKERD